MTPAASVPDLERLFRPRRIAIVGAALNDPARMGTRTLHDLVCAGWQGDIYPVSSRHQSLYDRPVYASLGEVPQSPDVVLARTPSAGIEALVDDAVAVGARFLVVLAAGFAESGADGARAQQVLLERAARGGLRIVGPQSIGLVNFVDRMPLSLSQIMERMELRTGRTALLTQSGAMAISLAVRGQTVHGLDFSYVATFGNSADVSPIEALHWLASDPQTDVVGLYLEGMTDGQAFAVAVQACRAAGKAVAILRSGLSRRGAQAVASHTASMSGDADAFRAVCAQLGVALCDSAESFLWTLKALSGTRLDRAPAVAFASISGGACALWADQSDRLGLALPALSPGDRDQLSQHLPAFLTAANPMDLGPAVFDPVAFEGTLQGLLDLASFNLLVVYLFTSSPTLMGGLDKVSLLERMAARSSKPVWVIWEAATPEEWAALSASTQLVAFRDLGQAAAALAAFAVTRQPARFAPIVHAPQPGHGEPATQPWRTEPSVKAWLRTQGLRVPRGQLCTNAASAQAFAASLGSGVALKIVSPALPHKSDVGGVALCRDPDADIAGCYADLCARVRAHAPAVEPEGVLVEELVSEPGVELFVTMRRDAIYGAVTVLGRGGLAIEADRDYVVHVGLLTEADVLPLLRALRCAPLLGAFRGRAPLAREALARDLVRLQQALLASALSELELNPVLLTTQHAWILDALASGAA